MGSKNISPYIPCLVLIQIPVNIKEEDPIVHHKRKLLFANLPNKVFWTVLLLVINDKLIKSNNHPTSLMEIAELGVGCLPASRQSVCEHSTAYLAAFLNLSLMLETGRAMGPGLLFLRIERPQRGRDMSEQRDTREERERERRERERAERERERRERERAER